MSKKKTASVKKSVPRKKFTLPLLEIEDYAKILDTDIFELLGLQNIPQEKKADIANRIGNIIVDRVLIRLDSQLLGPEIAEMKFLIEQNDQEGLKRFFADKNIDIPKMMIEEAVILKSQLVNFVMLKTGKNRLAEL